jgi:NADPH-dependent ferric siderophore reductase
MTDDAGGATAGAGIRPIPDGAELAARVGATLWDLEVVEAFDVGPGMRRLRLTAPGLDALAPEAGQDLMVEVPADGDSPYRRRYTIRHFLPERRMVDVDIVLHGEGPGARWAAGARPGDHVEAIGPRGKVVLVEGALWHLFAGDESGLPAVLAMIEVLPAGSRAIAIVEVIGAEHEQTAVVPAAVDADIRFVHRGETAPGRPELLTDAVRAVALPDGPGHAYLMGELAVVAAMRETLVARGMQPDQVSPKAYWRAGVANAPHGEPPRS